MDFTFDPFVGLGPLKFGMQKLEAETLLAEIPGIGDCNYQDGKLTAFSIYPSELKQDIVFAGEDILKLDKLRAVLFLADFRANYGQAQGGSLYFMDLGCAVLQFESPSREFLFFGNGYHTGEPLRDMSPYSIESYYEDNNWDD
jgi:hypothetical protein